MTRKVMVNLLRAGDEEVDNDKQNDRMRPVTDERCAETAKDDVDSDANGQEETRGECVHSRQRIDRRRATDCTREKKVSSEGRHGPGRG